MNRTGSRAEHRGTRTGPSGREETQKIREWAIAKGYSPNSRGCISPVTSTGAEAGPAATGGKHLILKVRNRLPNSVTGPATSEDPDKPTL